jgi:hypothetical protein
VSESGAALKVFVSSTSQDLREYRAVARNVILDVGWHPVMMEHFGASPSPTVDACLREVEQCDLMLLLGSFRRGWVPAVDQGGNATDSITALELAHARKRNIPVLAMLASETWPGNLWEDDADARAWVKRFRADLNLPAVFFDSEVVSAGEAERLPSFRSRVREVLLAHQRRRLEELASRRREETPQVDYFESACDGLFSGTDVPFVSLGIYGTGPLSSHALGKAFENGNIADQSLATASEYWERVHGSRAAFLRHFSRVVREQEQQVGELAVFALLSRIPRLPLIVCATFDRLLDQYLERAGKPFVVISHILRSADNVHDGKILVLRPGAAPDICLADKVNVEQGEAVVYRPLGAPFLHDLVDPELELDTVVVTETDHLTFLRRLENQHTQIPPRLSRLFKRCPLLFLGYALDVWQYRLVMQVFQSVGPRSPQCVTRAVRVTDTPMEAIAWKRLNADVIPMDPNEFASRAVRRAS